MNILFLAHNINIHSKTGDAIHVRELAVNLAALGNKVMLVVGFNPSSQEDISVLTNNPNINLRYVKDPKIKYPRARDISIITLCLSLAKKTPPDIIYERNFSCRMGVILSKFLRIPLIVEINGLVDEEAEMQGRRVSVIRGRIGKKLRQLFFMQANKIVAVTPGIKEELVKSYLIPPEKIDVIPNGANTYLFKPMDKEEVKNELGLAREYKYVCFVGNLAPWQGVEYLIMAAPLVIKAVPEARFLIVGDGIMYRQLQDSVKKLNLEEYFIITGRVPYESVPKYINASDICVAPKKIIKSGYSPLKLYEYMACEKPVIATRTQGFEMLEYYNAGLLVDPNNPSNFSSSIIKLIRSDEMKKRMGRNGMKLVNEQFSWNNTTKSIIELCKKTL